MRVLLLDRAVENPYTLGLAEGLSARGVDVTIGGPKDAGHHGVVPVYPSLRAVRSTSAKAREGATALAAFLRQLRSFQPDVVHFQWLTRPDLLYLALARTLRRPVVLTVHEPASRAGGETAEWRRRHALQRRGIGLADAVLTHGPLLRDGLVEAHPDLAAHVHVVEHGNYDHVATPVPRAEARDRLGLEGAGPVFAFIGQLRPNKGLPTLLEAYARYRERHGDGTLVIAGTAVDSGYQRELAALAERLDTPVRWIVEERLLPQETLDLAVGAANQVVLPFDGASQSGSVILAMTLGRCVVTTAVGEVARTVGDRGLVVTPRDPEQLSAAMAHAREDPEGCDDMGAAARAYALEELAWPTVADQVIAAYRAAVARRGRDHGT
jgi:glycosyltransferase involved in cell wall biosynthesis